MKNNNAPINFNPYADNILSLINGAIKKALQDVQFCIPAIVKSVDGDMVSAIPAVKQTNPSWESFDWASITMPIHTPCGNGIFLSCPVTVGDTGWIIGGDLDPSLFFNDLKHTQPQNTFVRHKYQFGFFVPDKIRGYNISEADKSGLVISNKDGTTKIVIKDNEISILGKTELNLKSKSIKINTENNANVVIDGINFKNHKHKTTAGVGQVSVDTTTGMNTTPLTWTSGGVQ